MATPLIGISFPFRKEHGQFPAMAINEDEVASNIKALFSIGQGERVMRPTLGSNAADLVFESTGALLDAQLRRSVVMTLLDEPRAKILGIDVAESGPEIDVMITFGTNGVASSVTVSFSKP